MDKIGPIVAAPVARTMHRQPSATSYIRTMSHLPDGPGSEVPSEEYKSTTRDDYTNASDVPLTSLNTKRGIELLLGLRNAFTHTGKRRPVPTRAVVVNIETSGKGENEENEKRNGVFCCCVQ